MKHVAFFGDGEKVFALPPEQIDELEKKTGTGIGLLCTRIPEGVFHRAELIEIIRLALIGGGASPKEAFDLADTYAAKRPLSESWHIAVAILQVVWFGRAIGNDAANITAGSITTTKEDAPA